MTKRLLPAWIHQSFLWITGLFVLTSGGLAIAGAPQEASSLPASALTVENLEAYRKTASENTALEESLRAKIDDFYGRAIDRTREAMASQARTQQLTDELSSATDELKREQQRLDAFAPTTLKPLSADDTSDNVTRQLTEARATVSGTQEKLQTIVTEIEFRATRRTLLPTLRLEAQQNLESLEKELAAPSPADVPAEQTAARRSLLQARRNSLQSELALIDQELRTYETTARLWFARRDIAERDLKDAERVVVTLQDRAAEIRQREAGRAAREARRAAADAHPAVSEAATQNATLADENQQTLKDLEETRTQISAATALRDTLNTDFETLQKRAEAAGFSQAIGVLLRNQRNRLPGTAPYIRRSHDREKDIVAVNLQLIEWETRRKRLIDIEEPIAELLRTLPPSSNEFEQAEIGEELRAIYSQQRTLLSNTIDNGNQYLSQLVALDSLEKAIVTATETQADYIAEHVLWVRSAEPIGRATLANAGSGAAQILSRSSWSQTARVLADGVKTYWLTWAPFGLLVVWMLITRARFRQAVREDGEIAARAHTTAIQPTVRAAANSLILALPGPAIMWFVGWRLSAASVGEFPQSVGVSLQLTAVLWFEVEFIRQLIRKGGVCEKHFHWPNRSLTSVRRWLGTGAIICLPAVWILLFCEVQDDDVLQGSVGRLAFLVCTGVVGIGLFQLLRPSGAVARDLALQGTGTLQARVRPVWSVVTFLAPVGLAILSLTGYQYSALQLAERLVVSAGLIVSLILIHAILRRWLLVTYRQLAINRSRQKREAMLKEAAERGEEALPADIIDAEAIPEVSLTDVSQQTHRLIRLGAVLCAVIGLWLIWIDVLPALGILRSFELWRNQIAVDTVSGETAPWVTLADLVLAIGGAGLTIVAAHNIPGLMEIAVLQKLPMDAGARYAATSLTRYLIAVIGVTLSFWLIGIGWSSVQWLIAAMTVGLGFGLQEIFANFVSGLILLFERPIRVGDTVTVNEITGTVSRIRIRATTILDWDNKELIVPNRAFVTDNLINWTLSNPHLRMILGVGVAYGSDTRKTTELLYEVARENTQVLGDPEPMVVFDNFGDSSLNFELRLFVSGLVPYRRLRHELNLAIDDKFRAGGVEIAFPQRDLHLRSLPKERTGSPLFDRPSASSSAHETDE